MYAPQPSYPYFHPSLQEQSFGHKAAQPSTRTTQPIVTGTSVLGIKYDGGVMIAADTLASYGSLARFRDVTRIIPVGKNTVIGVGGDYSDFQSLERIFEDLVDSDENLDDGGDRSPKEIHSFITRVMYNRRNKFDPLWNSLVVGGFNNGESFLGFVDLLGTSFTDETLATGYGSYIARPLLRKAYRPDLTEAEARKVLEDSMRVLFYRDARALNRIQIASVGMGGITVSEPFSLATEWRQGE